MLKKVAMMQPTFLPWLGYFELIFEADTFIFCDDFQFVNKSFHQRNKLLLGKNQVVDVTVPVTKKDAYKQKINEAEIREDLPWREKLWKGINLNYHKSPYFNKYKEILEPLLKEPQENLASQNISLIRCLCRILGIEREFLLSSDMKSTGARSELVKNMLFEVNADIFYQAHGSFGYMYKDGIFPLTHIKTLFQNAVPKPYRQHGNTGEFIPYLSVLDALFNIGAEETLQHIEHMTEHWLTWEEMAADRKATNE